MAEIKAEFRMVGGDFPVTPEVKKAFDHLGYIIVRNLLDKEEVGKLRTALENDPNTPKFTFNMDDGKGKAVNMLLWQHPGKDITGMIARSEKVAGTMEKLLDDEVYHYHTKLVMKKPKSGGSFLWHQDYGYWYMNGCLRPDMATISIAVDNTTRNNGCLQVIEGSHLLGRIDHKYVAGQVGADPERVKDILEHSSLQLRHVELEPGDALFFHCNLLHASAQNLSENRRWGFLTAYNTKRNDPIKVHHHPQYTPMTKVPNSTIRECDTTLHDEGKDFYYVAPGQNPVRR